MKNTKSISAVMAAVIMELFSGCSEEKQSISNSGRFGAEPASGCVDIWCNKGGHEDFCVQEQSGQVFNLVQCRTNSNLYTVWLMSGDTNGIKGLYLFGTETKKGKQ